jgi:hypothetical protein
MKKYEETGNVFRIGFADTTSRFALTELVGSENLPAW